MNESLNDILKDKKILDKELIQKVLDKLYSLEDEGPTGSGWKSDELINIIKELEEIINVPEGERWVG